MTKIIIIIFLFLLVLGCKQSISFGTSPLMLDKGIPFQKGTLHLNDGNLDLKYLVVKDYIRKDNDDIAFYLHGFGRTEYEWVEKNGFGTLFYDTLNTNPELQSMTVVSISLGGVFVFIDNAPAPYNADLEKLFLEKIIPYFKNMLSKNKKVYLIGHSLGGFNSLTVSLRHPDMISGIAVISPYVAPISPFSDDFDKKGKELKMPAFQIKMLKNLLTGAYLTEENWYKYNPFELAGSNENFPFISISDAKNDLPGFEWSIDKFSQMLLEKGIIHTYCKSQGDHNTTCKIFFANFLSGIQKF